VKVLDEKDFFSKICTFPIPPTYSLSKMGGKRNCEIEKRGLNFLNITIN
jgi:hypothetical protein